MGQRRQNLSTKISLLFTKRKKGPPNSQRRHGVICGSPQFECSSVTMGTQNCEPMYSKFCHCLKNSFHAKISLKNDSTQPNALSFFSLKLLMPRSVQRQIATAGKSLPLLEKARKFQQSPASEGKSSKGLVDKEISVSDVCNINLMHGGTLFMVTKYVVPA